MVNAAKRDGCLRRIIPHDWRRTTEHTARKSQRPICSLRVFRAWRSITSDDFCRPQKSPSTPVYRRLDGDDLAITLVAQEVEASIETCVTGRRPATGIPAHLWKMSAFAATICWAGAPRNPRSGGTVWVTTSKLIATKHVLIN